MLSIVLARRDWREQDQVITFYTLESGKKEVIARSVKKLLSRNSAFLEPGSLVNAEIISGKDLAHLGSVEPVDILTSARGGIVNISLLVWSISLIKNLTREGERDDHIFWFVLGWIKFLNTDSDVADNIFLADAFIGKLFQLLGFDIARDEQIELIIRKDLNIVLEKDWTKISELKLEKKNQQTLHNIVYKFAQYHSEKKLENWAKLAYFSPK